MLAAINHHDEVDTLMLKKALGVGLGLAVIGWALMWNTQAQQFATQSKPQPQALQSSSSSSQSSSSTFMQTDAQQLGYQIIAWEEQTDSLQAVLKWPQASMAQELYVRRVLVANEAACHEELNFGDSKVENLGNHIQVYHQQDGQSKVSPSVSIARGKVCWLIEGNTGLDETADLENKLALAKRLP